MDRLTENIELLHHFSFGCLLSHDLFVDGLQSDKFTGKSMYCDLILRCSLAIILDLGDKFCSSVAVENSVSTRYYNCCLGGLCFTSKELLC